MMVCAHGDVAEFCKEHDMVICDEWVGDIREYRGGCRVIVTDADMSASEYSFRKGEMNALGYELVSTRHKDSEELSEYFAGKVKLRKPRPVFSDRAVIERILELRAEGVSLRAIRMDESVRHPDGKMLGLGLISDIIEREKNV